jgi:multidrug resistance efflux pump
LDHVILSEAAIKGKITKIGGRIEGRIKSIEVDAGQRVSKGDVLLRMEDRHTQASLARARAELVSATKELESEKMGIEQSRRKLTLEIERVDGGRKKAKGDLDARKGDLEKSQKNFDRFTMLTNSGAVSAIEMDRVAGDRDRALGMFNAANGVSDSAESNYQKAMNELDGLQVRESHLEVLESQIAVARAKLDVAEADQEATVIQAPEDGRVLERIVEVGGSAKVGEPMISLWLGRAWVEAWADERDLRKIQIGSAVDISLDSSPQRKWSGRVESIGLVTDKQLQVAPVPSTLHAFIRPNAMVPVRIAMAEETGRAQLGLTVVVGIRKNAETSGANVVTFFRRLFSWTQKRASTN